MAHISRLAQSPLSKVAVKDGGCSPEANSVFVEYGRINGL